MPGRMLSFALLMAGAVLLPAGIATTVAAVWGLLVGIGVGSVVLGVLLIIGGLFLVPTDAGHPGNRP